jgi:hypothetical protein
MAMTNIDALIDFTMMCKKKDERMKERKSLQAAESIGKT